MPKNLDFLFKEELNKQEQSQLFDLISLNIPEVGLLTICDANYDVQFGGIVYTAFPCKFNKQAMTSSGEVSTSSLTVANPDRVFQSYIEAYNGLKRVRVSVKTVYARFLDYLYICNQNGSVTTAVNPEADPTDYTEEECIIDSHVSQDNIITFQLTGVADLEIKLPRGRFNATSCRWAYKDPDTCGYTGALATCKKDLTDCKAHGRSPYFGGFPGIPSGGVRRIRL